MLVTLQQAVDHLNRQDIVLGASPMSPEERDLTLKLLAAEGIVLDYLKIPSESPLWFDELDTPPLIQAAILLQLGELWRFRGDDVDGQGPKHTDGDLSPIVTNILRRYRDPALA